MSINHTRLKERARQAAEEALYSNGSVGPIDVLVGMKLLHPVHVDAWRKGKIPFLEDEIQGNPEKITASLEYFCEWVKERQLKPTLIAYLARSSVPEKVLQVSASGNFNVEKFFGTIYMSSSLSDTGQEKLQKKLSKAPECVVFQIVQDTQCSKCQKPLLKRSFLFMEGNNPLCLSCAHLDGLEYLPSGDAKLTRRAKKWSAKSVVVVEFSRTRKRYERQGILVEKQALKKAEQEILLEEEDK